MKFDNSYWKDLYNNNQTGWDIGYVSTPIKEYIDQLTDTSIKILVPGAGNAYEAEYLHNKGFSNVYVLDYTPAPLKNLLNRVPDFPEKHLLQKDFFKIKGSYDLIIEQTFFSSLPVLSRDRYVKKTHELLKDNGKLTGLLFQIDFNQKEPPFGGNKNLYKKLFEKYFYIDIMETAYNSIKPRKGNELFIKLTKKPLSY